MITPSFTKLQRSIVTSSIWLQDDQTRLVWITLLALCDRDGIVRASPLGLAHQARVPAKACAHAIDVLSTPDPDSRDQSDGRRIERCDEGFLVLNYERVLKEGITEEKRTKERDKKAGYRARKKSRTPTGYTPRDIIAPREEDHPKSYEQYHAENGCSAPGVVSAANGRHDQSADSTPLEHDSF